MKHHFTVDVEEHYQVAALEPYVPRERWADQTSRVERNLYALLGLLERYSARGTFFFLGIVARRSPALVKAVVDCGHEVASHGWGHEKVSDQTPDEFRDSARRSKALLEDLSDRPVRGFRAPNYSILPGLEWALDILIEEGYVYDSSLFPIRRRGYGYPGGDRRPHWVERPAGRIFELPPATVSRLGKILPAAGGAYFRLFPYGLVRAGLEEAERDGYPGMFYVHPWEVDPGQPRLSVPLLTRVRHYGGLYKTSRKLERLLSEFRFTRAADGVTGLAPGPADPGGPPVSARRQHARVQAIRSPRPALSVVVPVYNEYDNVRRLIEAVRTALEGRGSWELIIVDDGSTDGTGQLARNLMREEDRLRVVELTRNCGQTVALQAGFDHARGTVVVTMDGDLQNDPCDIPALIAKLEEGYDLVTGFRENRQDGPLRKALSRVANLLIRKVTRTEVRDNGCTLRAFRRDLVERLGLYSDMHRFVALLAAADAGARIAELPVRHHARRFGRSKYGFSRVWKVLADLVTLAMIRSFKERPLLMFGAAGSVSFSLSLVFGLAALIFDAGPGAQSHGTLVFAGAGLLCVGLAVYLVILGLIAEVAVGYEQRVGTGSPPLARQVWS